MEENQMIITYFSRECVRWWKWWRSTGSVCVVRFLATRGCRLPACILCPLIFAETAVKHLVVVILLRDSDWLGSVNTEPCVEELSTNMTQTQTWNIHSFQPFGEDNTFHFQVDKLHALTLKDMWYLLCYLFSQREFRMILCLRKPAHIARAPALIGLSLQTISIQSWVVITPLVFKTFSA